MKLLRWLKAFIFRTFIADCPVCHKHFYGYQPHKHHVRIEHKNYRYVCGKCAHKHLGGAA